MEVKPYNIRTTIISPGVITTELPQSITSRISPRRHKRFTMICDPRRLIRPAVVYAMSQPEDVDINEILFRPTRPGGMIAGRLGKAAHMQQH